VRQLPLGLTLPAGQLGDPGSGGLLRLARPGTAQGELRHDVLVELVRRVLRLGQLGLGDRRPFGSLGQRLGQPLDLLGGRCGTRPQRLGPAGQGRQAGPPVGERSDRGQVRPLGGGQPPFGVGALVGDLGQPPSG